MTDLHDMVLAIMDETGTKEGMSLLSRGREAMFRFSNNQMTVADSVDGTSLTVFVRHGSGGSSITLSDLRPSSVEEAVRGFLKGLEGKGPSVTSLPSGPMTYGIQEPGEVDIEGDGLVDTVMIARDAALEAGAERVAGTFRTAEESISIRSMHGVDAEFRRPSAELSLRAFCSGSASGHGLSVSGGTEGIDPESAGREAGSLAKAASSPPVACPAGSYESLFSPMVAADIVSQVGSMASAFYVDTGMSFLADRLGEEVCSRTLSLEDDPTVPGTLGCRPFDDEGVPTRRNGILESGVLKSYLHNSHTARAAGVPSTGNAGLVSPGPFNLTVSPGDGTQEGMVGDMQRGIWVTNVWYLRYQNYRTGDFSVIPRDAMFLVEDGEIVGPVRDLRISDNILGMLSRIRSMSAERRWIKWWEVDTPTLCPFMLCEDVKFTRSTM